MADDTSTSYQSVNVDSCAQEPIHILGNIQAHGILFVLSQKDFTCVQVSSNVEQILGRAPEEYLGKPLAGFLDDEQFKAVQFALSVVDPTENNPVKLNLQARHEPVLLDGIVHGHEGFHFLELEPSTAARQTFFLDFYKAVSRATRELQSADSMSRLLQAAAHEFRNITEFDRVMIYKFLPGDEGQVVAESAKDGLGSFLDLRFPASDIPEQARRLYLLNPIRLIADVAAKPVPVVPPINPESSRPVDLSFSSLRAVSSVHIEYLKNMHVTSSMSVSVVRDGKLWGLVACHNYNGPNFVPYERRKACTFLGQVLSLEIAAREGKEEYEFQVRSNALQARFLENLAGARGPESLVDAKPNLLDFLEAEGAAVVTGGAVYSVGATPSFEQIHDLSRWFETRNMPALITDSLSQFYQPGEAIKQVASGVLALEISRSSHTYIIWFRPEQERIVTWGGNPNKPVESRQGSFKLSPRKSFEAWRETVRGKSLPWKDSEVRSALNLRNVLSVSVFTKAARQ